MKIEEKTQVKIKEKNAKPKLTNTLPPSQQKPRQQIGYTWDCPALEIEAAKGLIFAKMDAPEQHW